MNGMTFCILVNVIDDGELNHETVAEYDTVPGFVPRVGDFVRLRDGEKIYRDHARVHIAPGHDDIAGWVTDVVTVLYGGQYDRTVVEVYINPRHTDEALKVLQRDRRKP